MSLLWFALPVVIGLAGIWSLIVGGPWTWTMPVIAFVLLPLFDSLHPGDEVNPADDVGPSTLHDVLLLLVLPMHLALLVTGAWHLSIGAYSGGALFGAVCTMGVSCGVYGINVGHELGHRREAHLQTAAMIFLGSSLYGHFFIEHNRGHHRRVATEEDPASADKGQTVYAFWVQSVIGSWTSAWELENQRVARKGLPWWTWSNQMVRVVVGQGVALAAVLVCFGPAVTGAWVTASAMGALLLETVNYLEHYGLRRNREDHGGYERVRPHHSWNSNRWLGRAVLYELTRHSDHHANATRPYQVLRHHDEAPELPTGYPALVVIALIPPLFRWAMHPSLEAWETKMQDTPVLACPSK